MLKQLVVSSNMSGGFLYSGNPLTNIALQTCHCADGRFALLLTVYMWMHVCEKRSALNYIHHLPLSPATVNQDKYSSTSFLTRRCHRIGPHLVRGVTQQDYVEILLADFSSALTQQGIPKVNKFTRRTYSP